MGISKLPPPARPSPEPSTFSYGFIGLIEEEFAGDNGGTHDPDAPSEYATFLKTLAFQTGHTIQTHSRSYALDNQYPAKLQSDLIGRYYQSSLLWHRFLLLAEGDPLLLQSNEQGQNEPLQTIGYSPDLHLVAQDDEPESIEIESEAQDEVEIQSPESRNNTQEKRSLVRRQRPPRATRKRPQVEILEDITDESNDDFAPVNRQAQRRNKKPKITYNGG
ncbi:hypothetical protein ACLOAV_008358 [Pseudogymnoascus australis]